MVFVEYDDDDEAATDAQDNGDRDGDRGKTAVNMRMKKGAMMGDDS